MKRKPGLPPGAGSSLRGRAYSKPGRLLPLCIKNSPLSPDESFCIFSCLGFYSEEKISSTEYGFPSHKRINACISLIPFLLQVSI